MQGGTAKEEAGTGSPWSAPIAFILVIVLGLGVLTLFGRLEEGMQSQVLTLRLSDYPVESVTYVDLTRYGIHRYQALKPGELFTRGFQDASKRSVGFYLTRHGGEVRAFLARSPHMGEFVEWRSDLGQLHDVDTGSLWDLDGKRLAGPTPRHLDWFPVTVAGEEIRVDVTEVHCGKGFVIRSVIGGCVADEGG